MTTTTQRNRALADANQSRIEMARLLQGVRTGEIDPVEIILREDLPLDLGRIFKATPGVGRTKAVAMLKEASRETGTFITPWHRLGNGHTRADGALLTPLQREAIAKQIVALRRRIAINQAINAKAKARAAA